jgi:hypothetical protein
LGNDDGEDVVWGSIFVLQEARCAVTRIHSSRLAFLHGSRRRRDMRRLHVTQRWECRSRHAGAALRSLSANTKTRRSDRVSSRLDNLSVLLVANFNSVRSYSGRNCDGYRRTNSAVAVRTLVHALLGRDAAMRNTIITLLALLATCCNGQVTMPSVSDGGANFTVCDEYRGAMEASGRCGPAADPRLVEVVYDECARRFASAMSTCKAPLDRMYACQARSLACPRSSVDCSEEERGYGECVSGGTCHRTGGGQAQSPTSDRPVSSYENDEVCRCQADTWNAGAPGGSCRTWEDCTPVCCSCEGSTYEYTAAACDLSGAAADSGTCPSADQVCALTHDRCAFAE